MPAKPRDEGVPSLPITSAREVVTPSITPTATRRVAPARSPYLWEVTVVGRSALPIVLVTEGPEGEATLTAGEARAIALALNNAADDYDRSWQPGRPGRTHTRAAFRRDRRPDGE